MVPLDAWASAQPHLSIFAFSGFEGAKRHRLCRPNGNPFGLNLAGVLPFRLRAHRYYGSTRCLGPMVLPSLPAPSIFAFSGFEGAKRHRLCRPTGNPFGLNLAMVPLDAWASAHPHLTLLLAGSKVPNGTGLADQTARRWA